MLRVNIRLINTAVIKFIKEVFSQLSKKKAFICLIFSCTLFSCVPTITQIFNSPNVSGNIVLLPTLEAASGVNLFYSQKRPDDSLTKSIVTDATGSYELKANSDVMFHVMMPGHALTKSYVTVIYNDLNFEFVVRSTLNSTNQEYFDAPVIVIDTQSNVIAKVPNPLDVPYQQLLDVINNETALKSCDITKTPSLLYWFNTARKLYWLSLSTEGQVTKQDRQKNNQIIEYMLSSYFHGVELINSIKSTCIRTSENFKAIDDVFSRLIKEANNAGDINHIRFIPNFEGEL